MKQIKGVQLGAVLAAMLLVSMAFVPAVSAQIENSSTVSIGSQSGTCNTCGKNCNVAQIQTPKINEEVLQGKDKTNFLEKTLKSDQFKLLRSDFISRGYVPDIKEAKVTNISNIDTGESGVRIDIPFRTGNESILAVISTYSDAQKQETIGYVQNGSTVEILPHPDINQGVGIQALWIPGYNYKGNYALTDICFVVSGACVAFWIGGIATGGTCDALGAGCWIIDAAVRYSSCTNPTIDLYQRAWWNPLGRMYLMIPKC